MVFVTFSPDSTQPAAKIKVQTLLINSKKVLSTHYIHKHCTSQESGLSFGQELCNMNTKYLFSAVFASLIYFPLKASF